MKFGFLLLISMFFGSGLFAQTLETQTGNAAHSLSSKRQSSYICSFSNLPIKPERTISFTTDEASYIDIDISPDGATLLLSFLGNLYKLPVTGGIAKQLTRGLAINRCPVWSPDGKLIAYESDASGLIQLHIDDTGGTFHKILGEDMGDESFQPIWFPDSKQIVASRDIHHLTGISSSLSKEIAKLLGFSRDGKFAYYLNETSNNSPSIIRLERATGEKNNQLTLNKEYDHYKNSKISPDGNFLTFIKYEWYGSADSLTAIDLRTGEEKLLAHLSIKFPGMLGNQHYSFSNDSKYLFIGYGGKIHRIEIETCKNDIIPFRANVDVDMGALNYNTFNVSLNSFNVKYIRSVRRSPDGRHVVFSALNKIYLMDLPNGVPRVLVNQSMNQFQPTYSPDGKWIAYVTWNDKEGGYLWCVSASGGKPELITTVAGLYQHPAWSSDGNKIVVAKGSNKLGIRNNPGTGEIQVISIKDKNVKVIADNVPLFNEPVFLSDNKEVAFTPDQNDGNGRYLPKIVAQNIDSGKQDILLYARKSLKSPYPPIRQVLLSPDGRYVVFMHNEDLYLAPRNNLEVPKTILDEIAPLTLIRFARGCIDPNWEDEGKTLSWINASHYCRIDPDKIIHAAEYLSPNTTLERLPETRIIDVDISADATILIDVKAPRLFGRGILALTNARIITMHDSDVIENGIVVIKNGRIINVGQAGKVAIPKSANVLNLKGKTIMPGLIDMHSHMYEAVPPDVFLQQSWQQFMNFSYGVTTARDPSGGYDTFGYCELLETGEMIGPRLFTVGYAVRTHYNLSSLNEASIIVKNRIKMGATVIKQYSQPTRLQRQLLLMACTSAGANMTNEGEQILYSYLGQIKDGSTGVEHNPVWGDVYNDVITLVSKSCTYLTPTLQVCREREFGKSYFRSLYGQAFLNRWNGVISDYTKAELSRDMKDSRFDSGFLDHSRIDARIKHAGGKIVMGSHGEDQGIGAHWEIWALQMGGLTNLEALQTATITAAEGLGMQKDLGSIEVGKIADLIILDKNPLEDIHNSNTIKYVMKAGVLYDSETVDELWPKKKKCTDWRMKEPVK